MKTTTTTDYIIEAKSSETGWGLWERTSTRLAPALVNLARLRNHFTWVKFRLVKRTTTTKILKHK